MLKEISHPALDAYAVKLRLVLFDLSAWLSAMSYPDRNTLNRFHTDRLNGVLREINNPRPQPGGTANPLILSPERA